VGIGVGTCESLGDAVIVVSEGEGLVDVGISEIVSLGLGVGVTVT
jgi:hypothetical protein